MKIYFGTPGWGWTLWGIGYGSQWFLGFSMKRTPADDTGTIVLPACKGVNMDWLPATTPPEFVSEEYGWPMSAPALGHCRDGSTRVVRLERIDEDDMPVWKTDCSERWTVDVTHWMPLPQAPGISAAGTGGTAETNRGRA